LEFGNGQIHTKMHYVFEHATQVTIATINKGFLMVLNSEH